MVKHPWVSRLITVTDGKLRYILYHIFVKYIYNILYNIPRRQYVKVGDKTTATDRYYIHFLTFVFTFIYFSDLYRRLSASKCTRSDRNRRLFVRSKSRCFCGGTPFKLQKVSRDWKSHICP